MYYVSQFPEVRVAQKVKRLKDFTRNWSPEWKYKTEGSQWLVRKRAEVKQTDIIPVYVIKDGKLTKTSSETMTNWVNTGAVYGSM